MLSLTVDDTVITNTDAVARSICDAIHRRWGTTGQKLAKDILRWRVDHLPNGDIALSQPVGIKRLLTSLGMDDAHTAPTPLPANFTPDPGNASAGAPPHDFTEDERLYVPGHLAWISTTRPDLPHAHSVLMTTALTVA